MLLRGKNRMDLCGRLSIGVLCVSRKRGSLTQRQAAVVARFVREKKRSSDLIFPRVG